jgi:hypothetical protein
MPLPILIRLNWLPNGFHGAFADFCRQTKALGWVGLEPTTNALKGRKGSAVSAL